MTKRQRPLACDELCERLLFRVVEIFMQGYFFFFFISTSLFYLNPPSPLELIRFEKDSSFVPYTAYIQFFHVISGRIYFLMIYMPYDSSVSSVIPGVPVPFKGNPSHLCSDSACR